jgi:hypothetical protein
MPSLVPGIHAFLSFSKQDVDGRYKPGYDELACLTLDRLCSRAQASRQPENAGEKLP